MNWRFKLLIFLVLAAAAAGTGRLFYLQIIKHKFYQAQALGQQIKYYEIKGSRGEVFFGKAGEQGAKEVKSAAINKDNWLIFVIPQNIQDKEGFAASLADALGQEQQKILEKLQGSSYTVIKKNLSSQEIKKLKDLKLEGLFFERTDDRYYPQEEMASQLVGFVGGDGNGQYGVEGYYQDILAGKEGLWQSGYGWNLLAGGQTQGDWDGADLFLTIDYNIQFQAERLLEQAYEKFGMDSGQVIVAEPSTGRILALANYPAFNPNNYSKEKDFEIFQNAAVQKIFEPGSIFKPFVMAMALEENEVSPATVFHDAGYATIGPDTIYNFEHKVYGDVTMSQILEKSINTGAVFLAKQVGSEKFLEYVDKFGFNKKTGIDLQGEVYSNNQNLKKGREIELATSSYGQGIELTPIQLVSAFSVFANGGKMSKPYVVEKAVGINEEKITKPEISRQIISQETVSQITAMLVNVVEKGFGDIAKIPGYYLAGKTGTAQIPLEGKKGYSEEKTIQSFIGFGPALDPKFLILVKLDAPKVSQSALSAAPIFRELARYIINYWQIPPDY